MIQLFVGENSFLIKQSVATAVDSFGGLATRINGEDITTDALIDALFGISLFDDKKLIVISDLSSNKLAWDLLASRVGDVADSTEVILVETSVDKRTKSYKEIAKKVNVREFKNFDSRDRHSVVNWALGEAKSQGLDFNSKLANVLIDRVGLNQWAIFHALQKLAVLDTVDEDVIKTVIEEDIQESVFDLLGVALFGKKAKLLVNLDNIKRHAEPNQTLGLLISQVYTLSALVYADKPSGEVARDIGVHPYAASKSAEMARKLSPSDAKRIVQLLADADMQIKSSGTDPWLIIESALVRFASK